MEITLTPTQWGWLAKDIEELQAERETAVRAMGMLFHVNPMLAELLREALEP